MTCAVRHCPGLVTPPHIVCGRCLAVIARDRRELRENERLCREAAAMEREERESMKTVRTNMGEPVSVHLKFNTGQIRLSISEISACLRADVAFNTNFLTPAQAIDLGQTLIEWGKTGKLEASE